MLEVGTPSAEAGKKPVNVEGLGFHGLGAGFWMVLDLVYRFKEF